MYKKSSFFWLHAKLVHDVTQKQEKLLRFDDLEAFEAVLQIFIIYIKILVVS